MARHVIEVIEKSSGRRKFVGMSTGSNSIDSNIKNQLDIEKTSRNAMATTVVKATIAEVSLSRVNDYVGSYTQNTLSARRRGVALSYGAIGFAALKNPVIGSIALTAFVAHKSINYSIDLNLQNTRSEYLYSLTGGTINMSRREGLSL